MLWFDYDDGFLMRVHGDRACLCTPLGEPLDNDSFEVTVLDGIAFKRGKDGWRYLSKKHNWVPAIERNGSPTIDPATAEEEPPQLGGDGEFLRWRRLDAIARERNAYEYLDDFTGTGTPEEFEDFLDDIDQY